MFCSMQEKLLTGIDNPFQRLESFTAGTRSVISIRQAGQTRSYILPRFWASTGVGGVLK